MTFQTPQHRITAKPSMYEEQKLGNRFLSLQRKMMDNGWKLKKTEEGFRYFVHPSYPNQKAKCVTWSIDDRLEPNVFRFPIIETGNDPHGLGCSVKCLRGAGISRPVSNEWVSYWDTRRGRKKQKYLNKKKFLSGVDPEDEEAARPISHRHTY